MRSLSCECERSDDTTLAQAFQLITGRLLNGLLSEPDNRIGRLLASGKPLPNSVVPRPLAATPGRADVAMPPATDGRRLLVLAEPRSTSWRATLDGHRLVRTTAYGWAQAWWLPAGGGKLVVEHVGGHRHTLVLVEGVLVLLALMLCLPSRGRQR